MKAISNIEHITEADDNLYADIGFGPEEAALFQAESDARIAVRQAIKADMMAQVDAWIKREKMTQLQAAQILQVSRPRVTDIVNQKVEKFSIDALVDLLAKVGLKVQFTVA
jgi:predicted XRE-type DNA-binding protein